jgi:hypothetical protein
MYDLQTMKRKFATSNRTLYEALDSAGIKPAYRRGEGKKGGVILWDPTTIDAAEGRILSEIKRLRFEGRSAGALNAVRTKPTPPPDRLAAIEEKLDRLLALWTPQETQ